MAADNAAEHREQFAYWREQAACLDVDPELFFPIGHKGPMLNQTDVAKAVCGRCPVQEPCLGWALRVGQVEGIWGGLTEDERRALRRRAALRSLKRTAEAV
ncbi:WhiB family transcriptional regulator [Streptomyces sp. WMMC500]|uniref:WhiB family transcriptional regulator n=1 Tax=Streptomyces sp. WMMC500 TaxID=3015154 RepID=UPI00248C1658|nr:WhiB family transcriptional regulator [Streptomyces sp. WMMC500]WBB62470.1 WhiB family transcriptional regulator [Streptomyces sp. WMMC500]